MSCPRCGSERLFQFESARAPLPRPGASELPLVCRDCGLITIGGNPIDLPAKIEKAARDLAGSMDAAGRDARLELEATPEKRIEGYMAKFYQAAYLDGFFRALAFFRHNAKEGRIVRMRELWKKIGETPEWRKRGRGVGPGEVILIADESAYTEFVQLLHLNAAPETSNATRSANEKAPPHPGDSPL